MLQRNSGRWWTLTCHCEWSAVVQVVAQQVSMMQNVSRVANTRDLSGCTGARRPERHGHGGSDSSVSRGNCYNKKLLRSGRPRYCRVTAIQGPPPSPGSSGNIPGDDFATFFSQKSELDPCYYGHCRRASAQHTHVDVSSVTVRASDDR